MLIFLYKIEGERVNKRYVLSCSAVLLFLLFVGVCLFIKNNSLGPSARQSVTVRIEDVSDNEFICVNDEEIKADKKLGFRQFDKGSRIIVRPEENSTDFSGLKFQSGDIIEFMVYKYENENGTITVTTDRSDIHKIRN